MLTNVGFFQLLNSFEMAFYVPSLEAFWEIAIVFWSCYTLNIASAMFSKSFGFKLRYESGK